MKDFEQLEYELAEALTLNFFFGYYYLVFDKLEDVEEFLGFINMHDYRYNKDFEKKKEIKSVMWKYSNVLFRHQLEWQNECEWFSKYGAKKLNYQKIKPYVEQFNFVKWCNISQTERAERGMICDNCTASKTIKNTMGCNGDQLHNRLEILKSEIAKSLKINYEPKFQCGFADLAELEKQERDVGEG